MIDTVLTVPTPERVDFVLRVAGPGPRSLAWALDMMLMGAIVGLGAAVLTLFSAWTGASGFGLGALFVIGFLAQWFWMTAWEIALEGRTPGKLIGGLRVVRLDGHPASSSELLLRNLLRAADDLPALYGVGVASMVWDGGMRRLGDRVAGTVVVFDERRPAWTGWTLDPPISDAERHALPGRVALRGDEVEVIAALLTRRLHPGRVEELAAILGPRLSAATGVEGATWTRTLALALARATGRDSAPPDAP